MRAARACAIYAHSFFSHMYGGRGQTACWGKNYVLSTACRGKFPGGGGGGKLRRVGATITACWGQLRSVEENYDVSGQITSCQGKLRHVEANYGVSGQITCVCVCLVAFCNPCCNERYQNAIFENKSDGRELAIAVFFVWHIYIY